MAVVLWGRLIGAVLGIPAGVFGVVLGFLVGWLVDQTITVARQNASVEAFLTGSGRIRGSQLHGELFVAAVAVMMGVASADGSASIGQVEMMRRWLASRFRVADRGALGLSRVIDEAYRLRSRLDIERACTILATAFTPDDSDDFVRYLIEITEGAPHGLTANTRRSLAAVAERLGVDIADDIHSRRPSLDEDACALLGLPTDATVDEVRRVYRTLAGQFHPDANTSLSADQLRQSQEAFVRIHDAYERLMEQFRARNG